MLVSLNHDCDLSLTKWVKLPKLHQTLTLEGGRTKQWLNVLFWTRRHFHLVCSVSANVNLHVVLTQIEISIRSLYVNKR